MPLTSAIDYPSVLGTPEVDGYGVEPFSDLSVFEPDSGPSIIRRRTGRVGSEYSVNYLLSLDQKQIFDNFYHGTLSGGSLPFNWQEPITKINKTVQIKPGSVSFSSSGPLYFTMSMTLQEISTE